MSKIYFVEHPTEQGNFIAITHGESGYSTTDVNSQEQANELNEIQGITPEQAQAAIGNSMFVW